MLILSSLTAAIIVISKADIKVKSIIITITYLDSVISVISISFIRKKDTAPRSISLRNKTTQKPNSSLKTSADLTLKHLILVGVLIRVIDNILLILRVILSRTYKKPLLPYLLIIIAIIVIRKTTLMIF